MSEGKSSHKKSSKKKKSSSGSRHKRRNRDSDSTADASPLRSATTADALVATRMITIHYNDEQKAVELQSEMSTKKLLRHCCQLFDLDLPPAEMCIKVSACKHYQFISNRFFINLFDIYFILIPFKLFKIFFFASLSILHQKIGAFCLILHLTRTKRFSAQIKTVIRLMAYWMTLYDR